MRAVVCVCVLVHMYVNAGFSKCVLVHKYVHG